MLLLKIPGKQIPESDNLIEEILKAENDPFEDIEQEHQGINYAAAN